MLPDQHRKFVKCDLDSEVLSAAVPDFVPLLASEVLKLKLNISGSDEVEAEGEVYKDKMGVILGRTKATVWEVPRELEATQVTPSHILCFLSTLCEGYLLCEMCRHIPSSMWSSA